MKKMMSGFTLAEVLITLGIIGVIAAIVMPSVMTNYTYKTVGVKLSKFAAQLEGVTRPYVVQNTVFSTSADVGSFIDESFIIKNKVEKEKINCVKDDSGAFNDPRCTAVGDADVLKNVVDDSGVGYDFTDAQTLKEVAPSLQDLILKDGTSMKVYMLPLSYEENDEINTSRVGQVVFGIGFAPNVQGLPKAAQKNYQYVVTELGYVFPDRVTDTCIGNIYDADFMTNSKTFSGTACEINLN